MEKNFKAKKKEAQISLAYIFLNMTHMNMKIWKYRMINFQLASTSIINDSKTKYHNMHDYSLLPSSTS